jgi:hypothetical protein
MINNNILLVNIEQLKKDSYIDCNVDDNTLRIAINSVQYRIIEKLLGTCIVDKLKELICSGEIKFPENAIYYDLVANYLFYIFAFAVPEELNISLTYKIRNAGNVQSSDDTKIITSQSDLKYINQWYANHYNDYILRTQNFLNCNREFFSDLCGCGGNCGCNTGGSRHELKVGFSITPRRYKYHFRG